MKNNILKKVLIMLIIIMLISTDFIMLGINIISYAINPENSTNNENIEFLAYFKNEEGKRVENLSENFQKTELKLYTEIKVKNEGYFNGSIEIQNSNFKIKNNILSNYIEKIENDKVKLNQINAGEIVEIELDIEPITSEKIAVDMLSKETVVKLTGVYMETTYEGIDIEAEKTVKLELKPDEDTKSEVTTEIITKKIFSINGENKRVVQLLILSKLVENKYPIKQTNIKINIPKLSDKEPEEVRVLSLGTKATNGKEDAIIDNWKQEDEILEIIVKNEPNEDNEIRWEKDVEDELVVTFIYDESVDTNKIDIETNLDIEIYNSEETYQSQHNAIIENVELNNIITTKTETESLKEIYKGQMYENSKNEEKKKIPFTTITTLEARTTGMIDKIKVKEPKDTFITETGTLPANTKFVSTEINKEKMLEMLGDYGIIQIKNGEFEHIITKDTEANENGMIIINYPDTISEIEIEISNPKKPGKLEFKHNKAVIEDDYKTEQIKTIKSLKVRSDIIATLEEQKVLENSTETELELKETISKAELIINKESLSTINKNDEIILGVKLFTDDTKYDLYKNPKIKIQLPESVENIEINSFDKLYGDQFEIEKAVYNKAEKTIEIELKGEQQKYENIDATQLYLQISINLTLAKTEPSKMETIRMQYINENAKQYVGDTVDAGYSEKQIEILSPSGLVTINSAKTYNIEGISGISQEKQTANVDKKSAGGQDIEFKIALVNNTKEIVNNVKVIGNFPTSGEFKNENIVNNLDAKLRTAINAEGCIIYYSDNENATIDSNSDWTQNINELKNPKSYLIEIPQMDIESNFEASYIMQLPKKLDYDLQAHTGYEVFYKEGQINKKEKSTLVGVETGEGIKLETTVKGMVGTQELVEGDTIKSGEVIKYMVSVKNTGTQSLEKVNVKGLVPEGTVSVVPEPEFEYTGVTYYTEQTDVKEVSKEIPSLASGQTATFEYEVRVNMDITEGAQIVNKSIVTYNDYEIESSEVKNVLSKSDMRITIKRLDNIGGKSNPNTAVQYKVFVENMSNKPIKNLKIQIFNTNSQYESFYNYGQTELITENPDKTFTISEIAVDYAVWMDVIVVVDKQTSNEAREMKFSAILTDENGKTYRSNLDVHQIAGLGTKINMTSKPDIGSYVKIGDTVEYVIEIENSGDIEASFTIQDTVSEYLEIYEIYENEKLKLQTQDISKEDTFTYKIDNDFKNMVRLKVGEKAKIKIVAKVKDIQEEFKIKTISNSATSFLSADPNIKAITPEITHLIEGNIKDNPEPPSNPDDPGNEDNTQYIISGIAWLDEDMNGQKDSGEKLLQDINVKLFDINKNSVAKDENGQLYQMKTNSSGEYVFTQIAKGEYIVIFEYDTSKYEPTTYMKQGVPESQNSNVILKKLTLDGKEQTSAVTDTINLTSNVANINIGLKEIKIFDLALDKYINRIVVQNSKGTKAYDYKDSVFQKIEIHSKQLKTSTVVIEYSIKVKNKGEVAGYASSIVDYLPDGLTFSSELNPNWYLSNKNLYNKSLANEKINPGEEKELKLILTKTMTENNTGLINNRAELAQTFNEYGLKDINSTENNQIKGENDLGSADVIISVATGARTFMNIILIILNIALVIMIVQLRKKKKTNEKGRR